MKDRELKQALFQHYWSKRAFAQPEVEIHYGGGLSSKEKLITDVDVLALQPHSTFLYDRVLGDCKTLKGQSPIARVLWLRGLIDFLGASNGMIILDLEKIEPDHKLAASELDILLLNCTDYTTYDKATIYPYGSRDIPAPYEEVLLLRSLGSKYQRISKLIKYLYHDAFQELDFGVLIRHAIGQIRSVSRELDPENIEHCALIADASAIISIGVAECAGKIFYQYLQPDQRDFLDEALKSLIWGGREQYNFYRTVRERMVRATTAENVDKELSLPEWNNFVQLIRNILDFPMLAMYAPWMLRNFSTSILSGTPFTSRIKKDDLLLVKFSMMILEYICRASGISHDFRKRLVDPIVSAQGELASQSEKKETQYYDSEKRIIIGAVNNDSNKVNAIQLELDEDGK